MAGSWPGSTASALPCPGPVPSGWHSSSRRFSRDAFIMPERGRQGARGPGTAHLSLPRGNTSPCPATPAALETTRLRLNLPRSLCAITLPALGVQTLPLPQPLSGVHSPQKLPLRGRALGIAPWERPRLPCASTRRHAGDTGHSPSSFSCTGLSPRQRWHRRGGGRAGRCGAHPSGDMLSRCRGSWNPSALPVSC